MVCIKEIGLSRTEMMKQFGGNATDDDRALVALRKTFIVNGKLRLRPNGHSQEPINPQLTSVEPVGAVK